MAFISESITPIPYYLTPSLTTLQPDMSVMVERTVRNGPTSDHPRPITTYHDTYQWQMEQERAQMMEELDRLRKQQEKYKKIMDQYGIDMEEDKYPGKKKFLRTFEEVGIL